MFPEEFVEGSPNQKLSQLLLEIAEQYKIQGQIYRSGAYSNAGMEVSKYLTKIKSGSEARKNIPGIGDSISNDISEYLRNGTISRLQRLKEENRSTNDIVILFTQIYGIGLKKAMEFINEGYRSISELIQDNKLSDVQLLSLELLKHKERHPYQFMKKLEKEIEILLPDMKWEIAGSFRRKEDSSRDVDLIVLKERGVTIKKIVKKLDPIIYGTLNQGDEKYTGIIEYKKHIIRLDIRIFTKKEYPFGLMYFTGSQRFNVLMRIQAKRLGMLLNEYGLFEEPDMKEIPLKDEESIFDKLCVEYIPPEERKRDVVLQTY